MDPCRSKQKTDSQTPKKVVHLPSRITVEHGCFEMIDPASPTSDICLLLRAHAEQRWLCHEILPVLRQLEQPDGVPEEELGAALAYLEVLWIEASQRAAETDAAYAELLAWAAAPDPPLHRKARSYHRAVVRVREAIARHVVTLVSAPSGERSGDRLISF
jgi:hypothetical protein